MFRRRTINNQINHLHKRCLRVIYKRQDFIIQETPGKKWACPNTQQKSSDTSDQDVK